MLSLLRVPFELVEVDLKRGAHKAPAFLQLNPFGQVPVLEDNGDVIADSNAILVYLAAKYDASGRWLPRDALGVARVQRWLSIAAGPLAAGPATARLANVFGLPVDKARAQAGAAALFAIMEDELARRPHLAGDHPTIADVALYTYTAHAPDGDISLEPYPALRAWIGRVEALPGFVPMGAAHR
jgi:glutathione S-transferase